mmetsp:Transcript_13714/g.31535  ORF Transcript_13714/g.31535 Transcript_13714/m.31535 type:complete len:235 (-) Transcript_13714:228-932(-)
MASACCLSLARHSSPSEAVWTTTWPSDSMIARAPAMMISTSSTSITRSGSSRAAAASGFVEGCRYWSSRRKEQLVPKPEPPEERRSSPPSDWTALEAMARPRPIPPPSSVGERTWAAIAFDSWSAVMPRPESFTSKRTVHFSTQLFTAVADKLTRPWSVNLSALTSRLSSARSKREESVRTIGMRSSTLHSRCTCSLAAEEAFSSASMLVRRSCRSTSSLCSVGKRTPSLPLSI